jgi:hypothetical protein
MPEPLFREPNRTVIGRPSGDFLPQRRELGGIFYLFTVPMVYGPRHCA